MEKKPRRIIIGILSIGVIVYMWLEKDVLGLWSGISNEDLLPLLMTNGVVMIAKIVIFAGIIYGIRVIAKKIKNKKE